MPLLGDLDIVPGQEGRRCQEDSWRWYIRGNVVSHHSQRLIMLGLGLGLELGLRLMLRLDLDL